MSALSWPRMLESARREVIRYVDQRFNSLFSWTLTAFGSSRSGNDALEGSDDDVDPGSRQKEQTPVTRVEPWGFRGVAAKGVRGLRIRWGASKQIFIGVEVSQGYGSQVMQPGESEQYSSGGSSVFCDKDGNVIMNQQNGNVQNVGRVGDRVDPTTDMVTWFQSIALALGIAQPATFGVIATGSPTVKSGD